MNTTADLSLPRGYRFEEAVMEQEDRRIDYLPTLSEITKACARIRSEWTLNEKRRRYVGDLIPDQRLHQWRPPVIDTSHFRLCMNESKEV